MDLKAVQEFIEDEFPHLVVEMEIIDNKVRLLLVDDSFIDLWWSTQIAGRYAYHWERRHIDGTIYRHDNMPHKRWERVRTFPQHFHNGSESEVIESHIKPGLEGVREFLKFAQSLTEKSGS
jgi:hypothetical protein